MRPRDLTVGRQKQSTSEGQAAPLPLPPLQPQKGVGKIPNQNGGASALDPAV